MTPTNRKLFLEIYGLIRMALGLAELVALFGGYFLNEFILLYPAGSLANVLNDDIIALTYLAILFRSLFHVIAGVGIARVKLWARGWLYFGWTFSLIITVGVVTSLYHGWAAEGLTADFASVLSWPKMIVYLLLVIFDWWFVSQSLKAINADEEMIQENGGRMEASKLSLFAVIILVGVGVLLFLGGAIKQGFHQGYYKSSGQRITSASSLETPKTKSTGGGSEEKETLGQQMNKELEQSVFYRSQRASASQESLPVAEANRPSGTMVRAVEERKIEEGASYKTTVGWVAGLCLLIGWLFQILEMIKGNNANVLSMSGLAFNAVGFFLWIIYGMGTRTLPVSLSASGVFILLIVVVLLKKKYES